MRQSSGDSQASADFQFGAQRLVLASIPQAAIVLPARGYVPPEMWDEGDNGSHAQLQPQRREQPG